MMDRISEILKWVQKTNPTMTREKLIKELSKNRYSTASLVRIWRDEDGRMF